MFPRFSQQHSQNECNYTTPISRPLQFDQTRTPCTGTKLGPSRILHFNDSAEGISNGISNQQLDCLGSLKWPLEICKTIQASLTICKRKWKNYIEMQRKKETNASFVLAATPSVWQIHRCQSIFFFGPLPAKSKASLAKLQRERSMPQGSEQRLAPGLQLCTYEPFICPGNFKILGLQWCFQCFPIQGTLSGPSTCRGLDNFSTAASMKPKQNNLAQQSASKELLVTFYWQTKPKLRFELHIRPKSGNMILFGQHRCSIF